MYPAFSTAAARNSLRAFLLLALATAAAAQPAVVFNRSQYTISDRMGRQSVAGIAVGPDGHAWSSDRYSSVIFEFQTSATVPYGWFTPNYTPTMGYLGGIAVSTNGTKWWSEDTVTKIGMWPVKAGMTEFSVTGHPYAIAATPDGNAWFAEPQEARIGFVTPAGAVTEFPLPASTDVPNSVTAGPDGNVWFTLQDHAAIGRITPSGVVTEFPVAAGNAKLSSIASGPDGALWFVDSQNGNVLRSTTAGQMKQFNVQPYVPYGITAGPGGVLWFIATSGKYVALGRLTVDGSVAMYREEIDRSYTLSAIAAGTNRLWFPVCTQDSLRPTCNLVMADVLNTPMVQVTTAALPAATDGASYQTTLTATGGTPPYFWYLDSPPAWMSNDNNTGSIFGVPQGAGTFGFTVRVTDSQGSSAIQDFSLVVNPVPAAAPTITTKTLPDVTQELAYSQPLTATGGSAPYKWTVLSGSLPNGLTLNAASGVVSGVPVKIGVYSFIVQVTDSTGASNAAALTITVNARPAGPARVGAFSQVASGAGWKTSLYISNLSANATDLTFYFWADNGNPLTLPLTVTQTGGVQTFNAATWSGTIGARATVLLETSGTAAQNLTGWAEVLGSNTLNGYGVFHYTSPQGVESEATVPMAYSAQWNMLVPYELNDGFQAGIAMNNWSCSDALQGSFTFYDAAGGNMGSTPVKMDPCSHQSFMLSDWNPALKGKRGLMRFSLSSSGGPTGLGIRVNPAGGITSTPTFQASSVVKRPDGAPISVAFPHVAAGGGWKTSLYVVSQIYVPDTVTVKFHADNGLSAELPLRIIQGDTTSEVTASSTTFQLPAYGTVVIESNTTSDTAWTGWAEVISTMSLTGYGVFHYTSPEGVESEGTTTLDSMSGSGSTLPYEAEEGFKMGVAVVNLSSTAATATATAYDANGVWLTESTLDLAAGEHKSLMLSDLIPATVNNRGYVQFSAGTASLTVLGIRVNPTGGFTSAPRF